MAIRQPTFTKIEGDDSAILVQWTGLLQGDTGAPVQLVKYADRSVQVTGTFGAGGSVLIEGSNTSVDFATLNRLQGTPLSISSAGISQILENTVQLRPNVSGGDATTNLSVAVLIRTATAIMRK